ncbi:hypothetical protein K7X08_024136 [Anisodus acutangulus]|uniref:H15 domain-containing protein n=1 Tax=Anisodus acutangulus TaxID=402998 RepID=A0A9Q1M8A3_9SOLA|nr:hypothetical protein K7X08_024136 [Anisodus acutangulus]
MTTEPTFNPAQLVNHAPTSTQPPPPPPFFSPTHPDYAEMITEAITALKEKEGSSRIAIAKYIDRVYTNLPPNHSALLTHHLKRLKNSGYLAMVKHSYMLAVPGSAPPVMAAVDSNGTDVSSLTKRKPGRPPMLKPEAQQQPQAQFQDQLQAPLQAQLQAQQQQLAQFQSQFQTQPQFIQQPPQFVPQPQFQAQIHFQPDPLLQNQLQFQPQQPPQTYAATEAQSYQNIGAESVFVSLGLADGPVGFQNPAPGAPFPALAPAIEGSTTKRRPGRPRTKDGSTVVKPVVPKLPDPSGGTKRRPGRPPKSGIVNASPGSGSGAKPRGRPRKGSTPGRRGRPRKNPAVATNVANIPAGDPNATNIPAGEAPIPMPKRRGRPPRGSNQGGPVAADGGVGVTDVPIAAAFDSDDFTDATNGAMPLGKRRGRPPKSYSSPVVAATVKRPRKLSGKPLGRPKKNVTSPAVADPKLVVAYEELKGKLEHMQSRIREAANALKPCLNAETPATALAAMQELEELAAPAGVNPMQQN